MRGRPGEHFCVLPTMFRIKFQSGSRRRIADKIGSRPKSEAALYEERGRCRFKRPICRETLGSRHSPKKQIFPVTRSDCITLLTLFHFSVGSGFYERKKHNMRCCLLMGREPRTWRDLSNHHSGRRIVLPRERSRYLWRSHHHRFWTFKNTICPSDFSWVVDRNFLSNHLEFVYPLFYLWSPCSSALLVDDKVPR